MTRRWLTVGEVIDALSMYEPEYRRMKLRIDGDFEIFSEDAERTVEVSWSGGPLHAFKVYRDSENSICLRVGGLLPLGRDFGKEETK